MSRDEPAFVRPAEPEFVLDEARTQRLGFGEAVFCAGKSPEQITADSDRDRWFTAREALEYGFVDHIVARASELPGGVTAP